jgi:hypothetical protein
MDFSIATSSVSSSGTTGAIFERTGSELYAPSFFHKTTQSKYAINAAAKRHL